MEKIIVNNVVTKQLLDEEFAKLLVNGGWRPSLMPEYIDNVLHIVLDKLPDGVDYHRIKQLVIGRMKELDPILFKRD